MGRQDLDACLAAFGLGEGFVALFVEVPPKDHPARAITQRPMRDHLAQGAMQVYGACQELRPIPGVYFPYGKKNTPNTSSHGG